MNREYLYITKKNKYSYPNKNNKKKYTNQKNDQIRPFNLSPDMLFEFLAFSDYQITEIVDLANDLDFLK